MSVFSTLGCVWLAASVYMTLAWVVARRIGKAGIVDAFWAFGVGAAGAVAGLAGDGLLARRVAVAVVVAVWACRLGAMLFRRVLQSAEDGRYAAMMNAFGAKAWPRMFVFFQVQAFWIALFAAPAAAAGRDTSPLRVLDAVAILIGLGAIAGEAIADRQLAEFRAQPAHRGKTCRSGLWAWSRHPNYFFEWLHWFAYPVFGFAAPQAWLCLAGPFVMFVFLYRVTGIPWTEKQALRSRGDDYRRYQAETSAFIPLPPRRRMV